VDERSLLRRRAWQLSADLVGVPLTRNGTLGENPSGLQCVNLPNTHWARLGLPSWYGNASDWIGRSDEWREWRPWSRAMRLWSGDVCVFVPGGNIASDGHVDVVLDGRDPYWLGLDVNYPTGSPCELRRHMRVEIAGHIRCRNL
jgi:hypothetical protein